VPQAQWPPAGPPDARAADIARLNALQQEYAILWAKYLLAQSQLGADSQRLASIKNAIASIPARVQANATSSAAVKAQLANDTKALAVRQAALNQVLNEAGGLTTSSYFNGSGGDPDKAQSAYDTVVVPMLKRGADNSLFSLAIRADFAAVLNDIGNVAQQLQRLLDLVNKRTVAYYGFWEEQRSLDEQELRRLYKEAGDLTTEPNRLGNESITLAATLAQEQPRVQDLKNRLNSLWDQIRALRQQTGR
jgi:septal ring factor EnvC (AmiA/AmiB activator)